MPILRTRVVSGPLSGSARETRDLAVVECRPANEAGVEPSPTALPSASLGESDDYAHPVSIQPRRIQHFRIALSQKTVELPWSSRAPLLLRLRDHDAGLPVLLAIEAVGATQPVQLQPAGKRVLRQVVEAWYSEVTMKGLPAGVWELRSSEAAHRVSRPLGRWD
jgi:hypothetical protein